MVEKVWRRKRLSAVDHLQSARPRSESSSRGEVRSVPGIYPTQSSLIYIHNEDYCWCCRRSVVSRR